MNLYIKFSFLQHHGLETVGQLLYKPVKQSNRMKQYMVEIKFRRQDFPEIMPLVPEQQSRINELMQRNKITSYVLSLERSKLWMVVNEDNEETVLELLQTLPLFDYFQFDIYSLTFNNQVVGMPAISLN